jgi:hypothetical protein
MVKNAEAGQESWEFDRRSIKADIYFFASCPHHPHIRISSGAGSMANYLGMAVCLLRVTITRKKDGWWINWNIGRRIEDMMVMVSALLISFGHMSWAKWHCIRFTSFLLLVTLYWSSAIGYLQLNLVTWQFEVFELGRRSPYFYYHPLCLTFTTTNNSIQGSGRALHFPPNECLINTLHNTPL